MDTTTWSPSACKRYAILNENTLAKYTNDRNGWIGFRIEESKRSRLEAKAVFLFLNMDTAEEVTIPATDEEWRFMLNVANVDSFEGETPERLRFWMASADMPVTARTLP